MGFFDALQRGWGITVSSLKVVSSDPELLALPIVSGLIFLFILFSLFFPILFFNNTSNTYVIIAVAVAYFVSFFLLYFTQAMTIEIARIRFSGKNPKLVDGFNAAMKHLSKIVALAAIGAAIAILVRLIRNRRDGNNFLAGIIASLIGASWTIVSYFSLPVILYEEKGVFDSFKRSVELVKNSWGTDVSAQLSLLVLYIPAILFFILAILFAGILPLFLVFIVLALIAFVAALLLQSVVKGIISEALYIYASTGKVPQQFDSNTVKGFYK